MKLLVSIVLAFLMLPVSQVLAKEAMAESMKYIPVQDGGRIKPFDTFARESLQLIYGKQKYNKRPAVDVVATWFLVPQQWDETKFVKVDHKALKKALKLNADQKYFTPNELFNSDRLNLVIQELRSKQASGTKLDNYFQAVQTLENQLGLYFGIKTGKALRWVPPKEGNNWLSIGELPTQFRSLFARVSTEFVRTVSATMEDKEKGEALKTAKSSLQNSVNDLMTQARAQNPEAYGDENKVATEVLYNEFAPFQKSWIMYLLASLFVALTWIIKKEKFMLGAWAFGILGFILHTYGFGLRVYLAGRPPVSNMFETVIWVAWGSVLFAMIFTAMYRRKNVLFAGYLVSILCLITADLAPTVLDPSLQPLEPVLRSNLWLIVHVMTITLSYAAFFLAFGLGDLGLFYYIRGEEKNRKKLAEINQSIYRSVQIGVVLLAAGTILGGVWADYSWGRFWGWDPKETWALIALLGYLALLHGRIAGWLGTFGMIAGAVLAFSLVLMAWYGVNFVLGAGLHSYGFGGGGVQYVAGFVALHVVYLVYSFVVRQGRAATS